MAMPLKLVGSPTTPYARKARVILAEKRLKCEFVEENAWTADTTVPRYNPLNKVPALVMDDGEALYDSRGDLRVPRRDFAGRRADPRGRPSSAPACAATRRSATASPTPASPRASSASARRARQDAAWIERQMNKVNAGIAALEAQLGAKRVPAAARNLTLGDIAVRLRALLARVPHARSSRWREAHPNLKALGASAMRIASLVHGPTRPGLADHAATEAHPRRGTARPTAPA